MRQNTISVRRENRTLENFKSFISEEKHENYRVVVISNELGDKAITAKRMEEEANKLEYPYYIAPMDGTYTVINDGVRTVHKQDDEKGNSVDVVSVKTISGDCIVIPNGKVKLTHGKNVETLDTSFKVGEFQTYIKGIKNQVCEYIKTSK